MKNLLFFFFIITSCGRSTNETPHTFEVVSGDSIIRVASKLEEQRIIDDPFQFRMLAKLTQQEDIKIGFYKIPPKTSFKELLQLLRSGQGITVSVTIPEGKNIFEIAAKLEDEGVTSAKDFLQALNHPEVFQKFDLLPPTVKTITKIRNISDKNGNKFAVPTSKIELLEGYLFPETYYLQSNMNAENVVQIMTDKMLEVLTEEKALTKAAEKGWSLKELMIFASIVQKEATDIGEMPKVAGVYQNRIDIDMPLQADPTIIYALLLDNEYDGNIRRKHLRPPWPSPYNTYYVKSLPRGPIANPGRHAIKAALNPEKHPYFYFVRDPDGSHTYSKTLPEHNKAVQKWVDYRKGK